MAIYLGSPFIINLRLGFSPSESPTRSMIVDSELLPTLPIPAMPLYSRLPANSVSTPTALPPPTSTILPNSPDVTPTVTRINYRQRRIIAESAAQPSISLPSSSSQSLLLRIPTTRTLDDALRYWEHGEPLKGLIVPLSQWSTLYQPSEYRKEAQKLTMIKHVCEEFNNECGGDMEEFERRFPGLRTQYTKLIYAVREARIARGVSVQRSKQK